MPYTDFLKSTVMLMAAEATALAAVTVAAAAGDTTTIIFALAWWTLAALIGIWLGRRQETTRAIGRLLAEARSSTTLPEVRPVAVLLNRLWLVGAVRRARGRPVLALSRSSRPWSPAARSWSRSRGASRRRR